MTVSIITLNYNKSNLTISCLKSVYKQFEKEFKEDVMEVIIVDNASSDDSVQKIQKEITEQKYKNVKVVANSENWGFGKGNNIGAKEAKGKLILFLNNDTVVTDKGIMDMAGYLLAHPTIAILGGQLTNANGSFQISVGSFYTFSKVVMLLLGMQKFGLLDKSPKTISRVDWVKGGLFMIRSDVFEKLHGFDVNIFMYAEDMELCYRANLAGFNTYFYPNITIIHAEHGSTNRTFAIVNIYKSLLYFYKKHRSLLEYHMVKFLMQTKAILLIFAGTILRSNYLMSTYKEALKAL